MGNFLDEITPFSLVKTKYVTISTVCPQHQPHYPIQQVVKNLTSMACCGCSTCLEGTIRPERLNNWVRSSDRKTTTTVQVQYTNGPTPVVTTLEVPVAATDTSNTLLLEDFVDLEGWSTNVIAGNPETDQWRFDNPGNREFLEDVLENPFAVYDSDALSDDGVAENIAFESPVFDATATDTLFLQFDQYYAGIGGGQYASQSIVEAYNGSEWIEVYSSDFDGDLVNTPTVDLTDELAGVENAQVRFRFEGDWSFLWAIDNVNVVDYLPPGVTLPSGTIGVSESDVPDPLDFQFALQSRPTAPVTLTFTVDDTQLQSIAPLTFTADNWFEAQTSIVRAVSDDVYEGNDQVSSVQVTVTSDDPNYDGLVIEDIPVEITEDVIPGYTSYRTVEKTFSDMATLASNNPDLAQWIDIGDSYDKKTPGGAEGYDLQVLKLTNQNFEVEGDKPILYIQGSIHAREYSTAEIASRFAEQLVAGYGVNADITWLMNYFQIHVTPILNPDGRKFAEQGYSWRKNTNPNPAEGQEPAPFPLYGVDLNRNYDSFWGEIEGGASDDPSDLTYQGSAPFSEPESQAARDYLLDLFPDQKGNLNDPAPDDTTGVYLDLHSYGNLVLHPWGWTNDPAPNRDDLRNLGLKFGYYTGTDGEAYDVYQSIGLYPTSGTTDDWVYNTLGVAAYTLELGTAFFEPSDYFEETIVPEMIPTLFYAAKSAYRPYQTSSGPDTIDPTLSEGQTVEGVTSTVTLTVTADATRYNDGNFEPVEEGRDLPEFQTIAGARYSIDAPSWLADQTYEMTAADGEFDSTVEALTATIDTTGLAPGRHTVFVESVNANGDYGVPTAVFIDVLTPPENANFIEGDDGENTLRGESVSDVIVGRSDDDRIQSLSGTDLVLAGEGSDQVRSGSDDDLVYGGSGDDNIDGNAGTDQLYGEAGSDRLAGSAGDDLLWGGVDADTLIGGAGADIFVLAFGEGIDRVLDFKIGEDKMGLAGTLTFDQLTLSDSGKYAQITLGTEVLAQLKGVSASALSQTDFTAVPAIV